MKVCPICKSRCFDDMDVCYGCLHRFSSKSANQQILNEDFDLKSPQTTQTLPKTTQGLNPAEHTISTCKHLTNTVNHKETPKKPHSRYIPEYYEIEDNVDKYLMLEDVSDFLIRRAGEAQSEKIADVDMRHSGNSITLKIHLN